MVKNIGLNLSEKTDKMQILSLYESHFKESLTKVQYQNRSLKRFLIVIENYFI